ncbi:hypothetical protein CBM2634_B160094 [Cupriavidus taiwanensis]|uniref:Uncharacterized protein n=1 Tax=Cupriavidus taiwanensis TaxID=164546 RepID=A0A375J4U9_9BURK|nr:hypothetical protein CBM2634_B160094 [Cupriavidus taiwanensis]
MTKRSPSRSNSVSRLRSRIDMLSQCDKYSEPDRLYVAKARLASTSLCPQQCKDGVTLSSSGAYLELSHTAFLAGSGFPRW